MLKDINIYKKRVNKPWICLIYKSIFKKRQKNNNNNINDDLHIIDDNDKKIIIYIIYQIKIEKLSKKKN
jgi:hypothetical protein